MRKKILLISTLFNEKKIPLIRCIQSLFIFFIITASVNPDGHATPLADMELKALSAVYEAEYLHIFLLFDQIPSYTLHNSGSHLELKMSRTRIASFSPSLPTDETLIKAQIRQEDSGSRLLLSFSHPPQKIDIKRIAGSELLALTILPGNRFTALYPEIIEKMQELHVQIKTAPATETSFPESRYQTNWSSFFEQYEAPIHIQAAGNFLLPPFPLIALAHTDKDRANWLPEEVQKFAANQDWRQVSKMLAGILDTPLPYAKSSPCEHPLLLTFAEALAREGNYAESQYLLQRIKLHCSDMPAGKLSQILLSYVHAKQGDAHSAFFDLLPLREHLQHSAFDPYLRIMLAELALSTGKLDQAALYLADDLSTDFALRQSSLLRKADLYYLQGLHDQALRLYLELNRENTPLDQDAASLARFSELLYRQERYQEASAAYARLAGRLIHTDQYNLALFRHIFADMQKNGKVEHTISALMALAGHTDEVFANPEEQEKIPTDQGAVRALLKLTDIRYQSAAISPATAARIYGEIATQAKWIDIREEAGFKQALVYALANEQEKSVTQCMALLRGFQSGKLRDETMALLLSQFAPLLERLAAEQRYAEILILSAQNKYLFTHGWIRAESLHTLAQAYQKLNLPRQSAEMYRYLYNKAKEGQVPSLYPQLIHALLEAGDLGQAELFADLYLVRYPQGDERPIILTLKAELLHAEGRNQELLSLLNQPDMPDSPRLSLLRGQAFFATGQWEQALMLFNKEELRENSIAPQPLLLAETFFHTGRYEQAKMLFQTIMRTDKDQALAKFRLAQIAAAQNNEQEAIHLFNALAEQSPDPLWRRLAREEAALARMRQKSSTSDAAIDK